MADEKSYSLIMVVINFIRPYNDFSCVQSLFFCSYISDFVHDQQLYVALFRSHLLLEQVFQFDIVYRHYNTQLGCSVSVSGDLIFGLQPVPVVWSASFRLPIEI